MLFTAGKGSAEGSWPVLKTAFQGSSPLIQAQKTIRDLENMAYMRYLNEWGGGT